MEKQLESRCHYVAADYSSKLMSVYCCMYKRHST